MIEFGAVLTFLGVCAGYLAAFVRRLPWPQTALDWRIPILGNRFGDKPLSCPVCMGGWAAFPTIGLAHEMIDSARTLVLVWLFVAGVAALVFDRLVPPPSGLEGLGGDDAS